jgi:hypothetical protein
MITTQLRLMDPSAPRQPHFAELIQLDRRLGTLAPKDDPQDAALIAAAWDYVAALVAEIDRVRPPGKRKPLPWEGGAD